MTAGFEGVLHEEGDGHGADAAGDGGDGAAFGGDFVEGDVADEFVAFFGAGGFDAIDADINDDSAFFDMLGLEEFGAADGGDDDVGLACDGAEVAGAAMSDGDGGVSALAFGHEEEGHGLTHDHAATDDDGMGTRGFYAGFEEEALAAKRGAGHETGGVFQGELGHVDGVEAIDVFGGVDGLNDGCLIDVFRRWALDENAVDGGIQIQLPHEGEDFLLRGAGGQLMLHRVEAEVFALFVLGADISTGGWVITDEDNGEAGGDATGFEGGDFCFAFSEDFFGDGGSGDEGGHD